MYIKPPTPVGAFRFNTDSSKLEYYDGNQWVNITSDSPEAQTGGTRGCIAGGTTPTYLNTIEYVNIATTGNATDFGDTQVAAYGKTSTSSGTRGVIAEGNVYPSGNVNTISYVEIATLGNASEFGDLTALQAYLGSCSSKTRGIFNGGSVSPTATNIISYVTISTLGNAIDFGDMTHTPEQTSALSDSNGGLG